MQPVPDHPQPVPGHHAPAPPRRPVGAWPRVLTFSGAALLVVALASAVAAVWLFVRVVPLDLVTPSGEPGRGALGVVEVPGSVAVTLPEDGTYAVWEIGPRPVSQGLSVADVVVEDGAASLDVRRPAASGELDVAGLHGRLLAQFRGAAGTVRVTASDPGAPDGTMLVVAEGQEFGGFVALLGGTVLAWFVAVGGGMLGLLLTVGGIVWWALRRHASRPPEPDPVT